MKTLLVALLTITMLTLPARCEDEPTSYSFWSDDGAVHLTLSGKGKAFETFAVSVFHKGRRVRDEGSGTVRKVKGHYVLTITENKRGLEDVKKQMTLTFESGSKLPSLTWGSGHYIAIPGF